MWRSLAVGILVLTEIKNTLPLIPYCKPNTNLKISGLIAVSKRLTFYANLLESCQSEILFENQVPCFILSRHEPWALSHPDLSEEKLMVLVTLPLFFPSLCHSTLISCNMETERIISHAARLYILGTRWGKFTPLTISFSVDTGQDNLFQKFMNCIDKRRLALKYMWSSTQPGTESM